MSERDFAESIRILAKKKLRFPIIGGYAKAVRRRLVRATNDVDVRVATDEPNCRRIRASTRAFVGAEPSETALRPPRGMFRIGPPSAHVGVTTKIDGIGSFEGVWDKREAGEFFGVPVFHLSLQDMLRTKRAAGRPKDLGDIAWLAAEARRRRGAR